MPPLIQKWNALKDEDKDLFPLLEVCIFHNKSYMYFMTSLFVTSVYPVLPQHYNLDLCHMLNQYSKDVFH